KSVVGSQSLNERCLVIRALSDARFVFGLADRTEHLISLLFNLKRNLFKVSHPFECSKTIVDLRVCETLDSLRAKLLHIKRSHHRSKNHRASHRTLIEFFLTREVTHEAARKRVAGTRRIKH